MAGNTRGRSDTPRFSEMYLEGTLMLDELVSTTVTLDAINEVVDGLREGSIIRGVVEF
jgi:S-(hydroxymethyl)glutathione dehydrogenase/alcohol dehydrogenase